jgi:FkbM family methyltransferase
MHYGEDTEYYLSLGYEVVAVDADPEKCVAVRQRLWRDVNARNLEILNVGIAEEPGEREFWVSDEAEWSSLRRASATRQGRQARAIMVSTVRFGALLAAYREPLYVKIDIEGSDSVCLHDLVHSAVRPRYISFEAGPTTCEDITLLRKAGYEWFRCVRQNDLREIMPCNVWWQVQLRKLVWRSNHGSRAHYRKRRLSGRRFPAGSAGPVPWHFPGHWWAAGAVQSVWEKLFAADQELNCDGLGEWFDIQAWRGVRGEAA